MPDIGLLQGGAAAAARRSSARSRLARPWRLIAKSPRRSLAPVAARSPCHGSSQCRPLQPRRRAQVPAAPVASAGAEQPRADTGAARGARRPFARAICCGWRWRCVVIIGTGLGIRDPWPADEPRFAALARDMVLSQRMVVPARGRRSLPGQAAAVLLAAGDLLHAVRLGEGVVPDSRRSSPPAARCS